MADRIEKGLESLCDWVGSVHGAGHVVQGLGLEFCLEARVGYSDRKRVGKRCLLVTQLDASANANHKRRICEIGITRGDGSPDKRERTGVGIDSEDRWIKNLTCGLVDQFIRKVTTLRRNRRLREVIDLFFEKALLDCAFKELRAGYFGCRAQIIKRDFELVCDFIAF